MEPGLTDKAVWAAPSTIYTMVNHGSFLGIWSSLLYLQRSLPAAHHKLGMQLLLITLAFFLKPGLTTGEVIRRNQRGSSGTGEVSRPTVQGILAQIFVLFQGNTILPTPTLLAFGTFRGLSASAEGQEEAFACALKVAS